MHQPPFSAAQRSTSARFFSKLRRLIIIAAATLFAVWSLAIVYLWFWQETVLFHPKPIASDYTFNLQDTREIYLEVPGAKLHALYLRQPAEKSRGIVLFLHGNAGNLQTWFTHADFWLSTGYDVLMPDYRGFGKSSGRIESEAQLHEDTRYAWNLVAADYKDKKRVIYGRSLGTGLATKLATEVPADLLVLVSPYESMTQIAREYYPWVPQQILRYPLRSDLLLPQVHSNILLLHGAEDKIIRIAHSRQLQKLNPKAQLVEIPQAAHNDIHNFDEYTDTLANALKSL